MTSYRPGVPYEVRKQEAEALTAAMRRAGKKNATLAAESGVADSYISQVKSLHRPMSLNMAGRLAAALGVSLEDLSPRLARATREALQPSDLAPSNRRAEERTIYRLERKPSLEQAILTLAERLAGVDPATRRAAVTILGQLEHAPDQPAAVVRLVGAVLDSGKRQRTEDPAPESIAYSI